MLFNLLDSVAESVSGSDTTANNGGIQSWVLWLILGVFIVAWLVMSYFTNKKRKEQADAEAEKRNSIQPGYIVTTIGGIVGTVVSVDNDNNTFVLETGSEERPSQLKFDKLAIYTSKDPEAKKLASEETEKVTENENQDEVFSSENVEEQPVEEQKAEDVEDAKTE